eukprot:2162610-Amphidinium_carterae.1
MLALEGVAEAPLALAPAAPGSHAMMLGLPFDNVRGSPSRTSPGREQDSVIELSSVASGSSAPQTQSQACATVPKSPNNLELDFKGYDVQSLSPELGGLDTNPSAVGSEVGQEVLWVYSQSMPFPSQAGLSEVAEHLQSGEAGCESRDFDTQESSRLRTPVKRAPPPPVFQQESCTPLDPARPDSALVWSFGHAREAQDAEVLPSRSSPIHGWGCLEVDLDALGGSSQPVYTHHAVGGSEMPRSLELYQSPVKRELEGRRLDEHISFSAEKMTPRKRVLHEPHGLEVSQAPQKRRQVEGRGCSPPYAQSIATCDWNQSQLDASLADVCPQSPLSAAGSEKCEAATASAGNAQQTLQEQAICDAARSSLLDNRASAWESWRKAFEEQQHTWDQRHQRRQEQWK